jgi:serine/threonine-protein kinase
MWPDVASMCDHLVAARSPSSAELFDKFKGFLAYKGRGIPRRIVRTFNEYVDWSTGAPMLSFNRQQETRIKFFAGLQEALAEHGKQLFGDSPEETAGTHSDKRRLGVYYLIDWILRQGGEFTLTDAVNASRRLSVKIALAEEIAPRVVEDLIRILVADDYLQEAQKKLDKVVIGDPGVLNERKYVVSPRRVVEIGGAVDADEDWKLADVKLAAGEPVGRPGAVTRIGQYSVLGLIGQGGMGIVYRATHPVTGRVVAVKVLRRELSASADPVRRFEREARVMSGLRHPNIVQFLDSGHDDGRPYIVMELLEGATLAEVIQKRGRLPLDPVIAIALPIIDALGYVHERRIVRNDVKPNNVMLTPTGRVCIVDFGISRYAERDVEVAKSDNAVTAEGVFVGTPLFMAPEQLAGQHVDHRADVYSLGVMLYNMLTRVYPFNAGDAFELMHALYAGQTPDAVSKYASVPPEIDRVVLKCLARKPEDRYQTMDEVSDALHSAVGAVAPVDLAALVSETLDRVKAIDELGTENTVTGAFPAGDVTNAGAPVPEGARRAAPPAAAPPAPMWSPDDPLPSPTPNDTAVGKPRITPLPSAYAGDLHLVPSGDSYLLKEKHTTFGRADTNDIVLLSPKASRFHGRFILEHGACMVEDFGSSNPVIVNGARVAGRQTLTPGDRIDIGEVLFTFRQ